MSRLSPTSSVRDSVDSLDSQIRNQAAPAAPPAEQIHPVAEVEFGRRWREGFLDRCALCKKKTDMGQDIYMYGYVFNLYPMYVHLF